MKRNRQWVSLSLLLMLLGALILCFKMFRLGYPPFPDMESAAWSLQARVELEPDRGAVKAGLLLPVRPSGFTIAQENFVSRGFGLTLVEEPLHREADWAEGTRALVRLSLAAMAPILSGRPAAAWA